MNSNLGKEKKYLIYQITNLINGKIYVGAHITYNINDKYMGSSKYLKKDIKELGRQNFEKIPLHVFDNKEDMRLKEAEIVDKNFVFRNDTYNRLVGGIMDFSWVGTVVVKDKDGNCQRVYVEDPRYLSGELIHVCTGIKNENAKIANINTVVVKKNNKFFRISKNDSEWLSGELVPYNKGIKQHPNSIFKNKKRSDVFKNKLSEAAKLKIGNKNSQFGSCWITKGKENKKIHKEELDIYLQQGWINGRKTEKCSEEHKRKISEKNSLKIGSKNSQFETCWIKKENKNKKIKKKILMNG